MDCLLKCLKRGGEEERGLSVRCLSLLAVQLGPDLGNLCLDVERALSAVVMDSASQDLCRAEVSLCVVWASSCLCCLCQFNGTKFLLIFFYCVRCIIVHRNV